MTGSGSRRMEARGFQASALSGTPELCPPRALRGHSLTGLRFLTRCRLAPSPSTEGREEPARTLLGLIVGGQTVMFVWSGWGSVTGRLQGTPTGTKETLCQPSAP